MEVQLQHESGFTEHVENIDYDAKGQRTDIIYGNGSKTRYYYDTNTFRLTRLLTTRNTGSDVLQDLNYTYDPVGNIVEMVDDAQQTHYFSNTVIEPKSKYSYDALYRLLKATGREKDALSMPDSGGYTPDFVATNAKSSQTLRTYCEQYDYDALGNLNWVKHDDTCGAGATTHWKRNYQYNSGLPNNYLLSTYTGATPPGTAQYTYDAHGNMLQMPHLSAMNWDFADQLKSTVKTNETTHYIYSGGERIRKVVVDTTGTEKKKYERIYLGGYELYREYNTAGTSVDLERDTHKVMDDQRMIAILEVKTVSGGNVIANGSRVTKKRYQYTNHLDSACLELNGTAQVLSYEEYHPFGTTSYSLHTNDTEVSLKRYRYVHKERDDETGLYYYGARYYAPWLCRFVSVDPLNDKYPFYSSYQYAGNKPITFIDLDGFETAPNDTLKVVNDDAQVLEPAPEESPNEDLSTEEGSKYKVSRETVGKIFPKANSNVLDTLVVNLNKHIADFGIDNDYELAHFLAQAGHETGGFNKSAVTESLNYSVAGLLSTFSSHFVSKEPKEKKEEKTYNVASDYGRIDKKDLKTYDREETQKAKQEDIGNIAYGNRLGNAGFDSGEGYKFRGRGIFQLTGKSNYQAFTNFYQKEYDSSKDFITNPDLIASDPEIALISALWHYKLLL